MAGWYAYTLTIGAHLSRQLEWEPLKAARRDPVAGVQMDLDVPLVKRWDKDHWACPRCGLTLVQRRNRRSDEMFWGCTGFHRIPKCDYTAPILPEDLVPRKGG